MRRGEIRTLKRQLRSMEVTLLRQALRLEALELELTAARLALLIMGADMPPELPPARAAPPLRLVGGSSGGRVREEGE